MFYKKSGKRILTLIIIIVLHKSLFFAQSNLEFANKFYDSDDYSNSVVYFKKTIFEDKQYNGVIFYRYAYSLEKIGSDESYYAPFYAASAYCFKKANDTEGKYYSYAVAKEETLDISHEKFTDKTIDKLVEGKTITSFEYKDKTFFWLELIGSLLIIIYVIGRKVSSKTNCVILSSVGEVILLLLPIILIIVLLFQEEKIPEKTEELLFIGFSCISFVSAIGFSIYENCYSEHPILYTIISIIVKFGLFCLIPIVLIIILSFPSKKEEKDRRYKDGTRNNQKTKNWKITIFLFTYFAGLITSLIKEPNRKTVGSKNT